MLFRSLYNAGLITRNFGYGYEDYPGCAFFALGGESKDPQAVREQVLAECKRLADEGFAPEVFERMKKAAYGGMVSQLNSFENTAVELAQSYFDGVDYLTFPEVFRAITARDVQDFIKGWFVEAQAALAVITPGGEQA